MNIVKRIKKILTGTPPFYKKNKKKYNWVIDKSIVISLEYLYFYCRIAKAANTTIIASLINHEKGIKYDRIELKSIKKNNFLNPSKLNSEQIQNIDKFFKFIFVRNPYSRFLSCYINKIRDKNSSSKKRIILGVKGNENISVDTFLSYLENGGLYSNPHWAPQTYLMYFEKNKMDFIGKVESIEQDFKVISSKIYGKPVELITINDHSTRYEAQKTQLTEIQKDRIYKLYQEDFIQFGYLK